MDDNKKNEEALSESEIQEKKLRAAKAARKRKKENQEHNWMACGHTDSLPRPYLVSKNEEGQ